MEPWEFEHPVSLGMKEMDRKHGSDWVAPTLIDLSKLDLSDVNYCVLGQCYTSYHVGLLKMTENPVTAEKGWRGISGEKWLEISKWAVDHGFNLLSKLSTSENWSANWSALSEAWKNAITAARIERGFV